MGWTSCAKTTVCSSKAASSVLQQKPKKPRKRFTNILYDRVARHDISDEMKDLAKE
jgi:hypothetical protein